MPTRNPSTRSGSTFERVGLLVAGATLSWAVLRFVERSQPSPTIEASPRGEDCEVSPSPAERFSAARIERAAMLRDAPAKPLLASLTDEDEESGRDIQLRAWQQRVVARLERRIAHAFPGQSPERVAAEVADYLNGTLDAIADDPERVAALSEKIESTLCGGTTPAPTMTMIYMRAIQKMPELATGEGFDCFFNGHPKEDAVLWSALDALKATDLEMPTVLAALKRSAQLPATQIRFMSPEELRKVQDAQLSGQPPGSSPALPAEAVSKLMEQNAPTPRGGGTPPHPAAVPELGAAPLPPPRGR